MSSAFGEGEIHKVMIGGTSDGCKLRPIIGQVMNELALAMGLNHRFPQTAIWVVWGGYHFYEWSTFTVVLVGIPCPFVEPGAQVVCFIWITLQNDIASFHWIPPRTCSGKMFRESKVSLFLVRSNSNRRIGE